MMVKVKEYRGHIRNWEALCAELGIDKTLSREAREEAILVKAYETWGCKMADHMHGMFAFALWDEGAERLFCLRDQFGTKPFYYYVTEDGRLLYGTMIRQIMEQDGFVKVLNDKLLQIYMSLTYIPGEETFFEGVKKLLPGRYLIWEKGKLTIERYWKPEFHPDENLTLEELADELHETVKAIMPETKAADEEIDSFLSGGVDSSYVLALSKASAADSCGYEEERFDESKLAAETAKLLGVQFNRCVITPEQYFDIVPYVMYNMEQPLGDASAIAFALGCKATAEHTKLCYSGEGSDEFFGGYNMYRNAERYGDNLKTFYVGNTNIMKEDEKKVILKNYYEDVLPINLVKEMYEEKYGLTTSERVYGTVKENQLGNGPCYLKTTGITKEQDEELLKAYLNMAPSQTLKWIESGKLPSEQDVEIQGTEPYIVGGHTASGYWVDTNRQTTVQGLYAAGDVAGGCPQKYVTGALAEGKIAALAILENGMERKSDLQRE